MKKKRVRLYLIALLFLVFFDCILLIHLKKWTQGEYAAKGTERVVAQEIRFFPLAVSTDASVVFDFSDTWLTARTYGGDRRHEGCDVITPENIRGVYPVVSMTDGVVEAVGWLRLGGYRIGIRSPGGIYYYYAHLESYAADFHEGQEVLAGQLLGFAGDSGYGEEGTVGQFVVHLHIGIYVPDSNGADTAVNPFPYLDAVREHVIYAEYGTPD